VSRRNVDKGGRPPLPEGEAKSVVFTLRITEAERAELEAAAKLDDEPVTRWARNALVEHARSRLAETVPA